jgi:hypothetical protein
VIEAHGLFLDELAGGLHPPAGQPELTTATRHLEQRRLGGATAAQQWSAEIGIV